MTVIYISKRISFELSFEIEEEANSPNTTAFAIAGINKTPESMNTIKFFI